MTQLEPIIVRKFFFFLTVGERKKKVSFLHWNWKQANVGREYQDPFATMSEMSTEEMDSGEKEKNWILRILLEQMELVVSKTDCLDF